MSNGNINIEGGKSVSSCGSVIASDEVKGENFPKFFYQTWFVWNPSSRIFIPKKEI